MELYLPKFSGVDDIVIESASTVMDVNGEPMKVFICTDKIIESNKLQCVSNPINFANIANAISTPDGLYSEEIFGNTQDERKINHAYFDLHHKFFHPYVFEVLCELHGKIKEVCQYGGERSYAIKDGKIIEIKDEEDSRYDINNSGLAWVIKNYDNLEKKKNGSRKHDDQVDFLNSLSKDEIFITKFLIIPRHYRDYNREGTKIIEGEINAMYVKLIGLCNSLSEGVFGYSAHKTLYAIQNGLVVLRAHGQKLVEKKNGFFHKSVLARNTSFGTRGVISVPTLRHCDLPDDRQINMLTDGLPLSMCIEAANPFIMRWLERFVEDNWSGGSMAYYVPSKDNPSVGVHQEIRIKNHIHIFDNKYLSKRLLMFVKGFGGRWEPIQLETEDGSYVYPIFTGRGYASHADADGAAAIASRPLTWCDLIYMAAEDSLSDKHMYVTRYPAEDYFNVTPSRVTVLSTIKTAPMYVNGRLYKHYPVINPFEKEENVARSFIDTISVANVHLAGLHGDYDGDTLSVKVCFSQEANEEAEARIKALAHYLTLSGGLIRILGNESNLCMYNMTRRATK